MDPTSKANPYVVPTAIPFINIFHDLIFPEVDALDTLWTSLQHSPANTKYAHQRLGTIAGSTGYWYDAGCLHAREPAIYTARVLSASVSTGGALTGLRVLLLSKSSGGAFVCCAHTQGTVARVEQDWLFCSARRPPHSSPT
jgi:hypothetical protein